MASGPAGYVNLLHKVGYMTASVLRRGINDFSLPSAAGPYMTNSIRLFFETSAAGTLAISLDSDPGVVYDRAVLWLSIRIPLRHQTDTPFPVYLWRRQHGMLAVSAMGDTARADAISSSDWSS